MFRRWPGLALALLSACSPQKEKNAGGIAEIASSSLALRPTAPAAAQSVAEAPAKPSAPRPKDSVDLIVSPEKRARVERLAPEARGFLTSDEIEKRLYAMELKRGKDKDAVKALDQIARGKWVLFTGNVGNLTDQGCELPIRYTPKDPNDSLGLTSVWVPIRLSGIKGYDRAEYDAGDLAVILARYDGEQKATPGYDVVLLRSWFAP